MGRSTGNSIRMMQPSRNNHIAPILNAARSPHPPPGALAWLASALVAAALLLPGGDEPTALQIRHLKSTEERGALTGPAIDRRTQGAIFSPT
jgi:hypothetical protein